MRAEYYESGGFGIDVHTFTMLCYVAIILGVIAGLAKGILKNKNKSEKRNK